MFRLASWLTMGVAFTVGCQNAPAPAPTSSASPSDSETASTPEIHLRNVRQLTFGGDNAEAYWSFASDALVYQTTQPQAGIPCDQIFVMPLDQVQRIRTGETGEDAL